MSKLCITCQFYKKSEMESEENDVCLHTKAEYHTGKGIREPVVMGHYRCGSMLEGICKDHCLWQPKLEAA